MFLYLIIRHEGYFYFGKHSFVYRFSFDYPNKRESVKPSVLPQTEITLSIRTNTSSELSILSKSLHKHSQPLMSYLLSN